MGSKIVTERFLTTDDGVELYVRETRGPGRSKRAPLICANGIGVSTFFWKFIERDFHPERPVIVWDYRGHGKSGRPRDLKNLTIRRNAQDLVAVLDAFGHDKAVLIGHSMGVQVIFETYRIAASRVAAMIPMFGTYGRPVDTFWEMPIAAPIAFLLVHKIVTSLPKRLLKLQQQLKRPMMAKFASRFARLARLVHPELMPQTELDAYIAHFGDFDPEVFFRMAEKMATHTVDDILEKVHVPVLVVAGDKDLFTPLWLSEEMADRLPRARLLIMTGGSHAGMVEQPDLIDARVREFLVHELHEPERSQSSRLKAQA